MKAITIRQPWASLLVTGKSITKPEAGLPPILALLPSTPRNGRCVEP